MFDAKVFLSKDSFLGGNFTCILFNNIVYRFRISDNVVKFLDLIKDGKDYILKLEYSENPFFTFKSTIPNDCCSSK